MCGEGVSTGLVLGLAGWRAGGGCEQGPQSRAVPGALRGKPAEQREGVRRV